MPLTDQERQDLQTMAKKIAPPHCGRYRLVRRRPCWRRPQHGGYSYPALLEIHEN
jgi:hypothetical protein